MAKTATKPAAVPGKISKNARTGGSKTMKFFCPCGGEIHMFAQAKSFRLTPQARCDKCGTVKRRPRDFAAI